MTDIGPGIWEFYVTAIYEGGESAPSNSVVVQITSNQDNQNEVVPLSLNVYPNPFQKTVNFDFKGLKSTQPTWVTIYNSKGQIVRQTSFSGKDAINWNWDGKDRQNLDVSPGLYLVKMMNGQESRIAKVMKY
jgi:flagellar hook assembly protein FlgD